MSIVPTSKSLLINQIHIYCLNHLMSLFKQWHVYFRTSIKCLIIIQFYIILEILKTQSPILSRVMQSFNCVMISYFFPSAPPFSFHPTPLFHLLSHTSFFYLLTFYTPPHPPSYVKWSWNKEEIRPDKDRIRNRSEQSSEGEYGGVMRSIVVRTFINQNSTSTHPESYRSNH